MFMFIENMIFSLNFKREFQSRDFSSECEMNLSHRQNEIKSLKIYRAIIVQATLFQGPVFI